MAAPVARPLLAAALVAAAGAAAAQTADTITVTGTRGDPATLEAQATAFVHATGVAYGEVPAARWAEPVCPRVIGLTDRAAADLVERTVRRVAADAGIALAPVRCRGNLAVVFAAAGGAVVRDIVARRPRAFGRLRPGEVAALAASHAPVRWWYSSELRDSDSLVGGGSASPSLVGFGAAETADGTDGIVEHYSTSLISTGDARVLRAATVVVDVGRTAGLPLGAVAGYAAMVALAEIRPGGNPPDSILGLFGGGPVAHYPTAWDLAFLRALYKVPLDRTALQQRARLVGELVAGVR